MEEIHIDTDAIYEIDKRIKKVISEIQELIDTIFELIEKMPEKTEEWKGISAEKFVTLAKADSENYYLLKDNLTDFSFYLDRYCTEMNDVMRQVMR